MMWPQQWRQQTWEKLDQPWDLIIVGGGITGAGILREAARLGCRALLLEQRDFAWGTSSRSSKFVHGGLRYLKEGQIGLTRDAVHEREQLLAVAPGLVEPIGFLLATYTRDKIGRLVYRAGLSLYDLLALQWSHKYYGPADFQMLAPHIETSGLKGGFRYYDAQTDDARLVLRVIREAVAESDGRVQALNYAAVQNLVRDEHGRVTGVSIRDEETGASRPATARVVVNATGAWADTLRQEIGCKPVLRPLRGSHLILPGWRLPVAQVLTFLHPLDQRPVMIFPWEGVTLVGTTDIDHKQPTNEEPAITPEEVAYLMVAIHSQFPSLNITLDDVMASFAGIRPVIGSGKEDPSDESRDHMIWYENGLLTVTGGKMTTFRLIALQALKMIRHELPALAPLDEKAPVLSPPPEVTEAGGQLDAALQRRLRGRYGRDIIPLLQATQPGELVSIPGTHTVWAELRWAARDEGVVHLDDLLLRRVRIGLQLPQGGRDQMARIRAICQPELGWDDARWQAEEERYFQLWQQAYSLPGRDTIPDWQEELAQILAATAVIRKRPWLSVLLLLGLVPAIFIGLWLLWRLARRPKHAGGTGENALLP